jgi:acetylornithine/N-succinyldiaminopimelate aminotransferase
MIHQPAITNDTPFVRNYSRTVLQLVEGRGARVRDANGNRYIDLGAGIAVNAFGYGNGKLARIVGRQMKRLVHVSNLYTTPSALELGGRLLELLSPFGRNEFTAVHLGNSGSEANEAAIKYARLYARETRGDGHHAILSFTHAFHGRTLGALSATPKKAYRQKFEPLVPGFETAEYNDADSLDALLTDRFAAVIVESVQGEGGLSVIDPTFAARLSEICAERDILLIADEIQTGLGRTGSILAAPQFGLVPDIVTLSKPLAAGLPLSATLIPERVNALVSPGDHGTTFGGGPVTCAAALYVLDRLTSPGFLDSVGARAVELDTALNSCVERYPWITGVRGAGMLRGLTVDLGEAHETLFPEIITEARSRGILILRSAGDVIRIAPPLTISHKELANGLARLGDTLAAIDARRKR